MRTHRWILGLLPASLLATVVVGGVQPASASLAWADDPCEENGGQVAVVPDKAAAAAASHPIAYVACGDGSLLYHGEDGKGTNYKIPEVDTDDFVDVASTTNHGMYALTRYGRIETVHGATHLGELASSADSVALETTPSGQGYWIVTAAGHVAGFGDANDLGPQEDTTVHSPVVAFAPHGTTGGWVVTALGEVVAVGNAPDHGGVAGRVGQNDRVVGIVADRSSNGFWVVTRGGHILEAGGAAAEPDAAKCQSEPGGQPPFTGAVADPDPNSRAPLWIYSANGGICGFNPGA
ncbi:hypothetical protein [Nocardioides speluncae]|uniref:hypothetical protein n=1 Tax=Nocardioides speluncae TaxID=2670337 RepID=UPI000D696B30|nr:hypothetical protein [Nocardioides speluncae]